LYRKNNPLIASYRKDELLDILSHVDIHSPEFSDSDNENGRNSIVKYDYGWRSDEVTDFT
jgi:hypothetical protein